MAMTILLAAVACYLSAGLCFVPLFYSKGIRLVDASVKGSSIGFYIIIIPGVIALWPLLVRLWIKTYKGKRDEQTAS